MDPNRVIIRLDRHAKFRRQMQNRAVAHVQRIVGEFGGWYDHAAITAMAAEVVAIVEAAQRNVAVATDAYLAEVASEIVGRRIRPVGAIDVTRLREGVTHAGAYGRIADQYRYGASRGGIIEDLVSLALARATAMVATDIGLAFTHQARAGMLATRQLTGYRRIIRPELSNGGACGICLAASDRIYHRGDLLPLHDGCQCTVLPIVNGIDPGRTLNRQELDRLYDDAGSTRRADLVKVRYRIERNGEIGPVLVNAKHKHRGPRQVAAAA